LHIKDFCKNTKFILNCTSFYNSSIAIRAHASASANA
jgi:hypothetical protein